MSFLLGVRDRIRLPLRRGVGEDELDVHEERDASWLCATHARIFLRHASPTGAATASGASDELRRSAFRFSYDSATALAPLATPLALEFCFYTTDFELQF